MIYIKTLVVVFLFAVSNVLSQEQILLKNINVIDVETGTIRENTNVFISNGVIRSIGEGVPRGYAETFDCTGKWLVPGLVDAHIHLFQSAGLYTRPDVIDLQKFRDYTTEMDWVWKHSSDFMKRYLRCGITTVIDMGGPFENFNARDRLADNTQYPNLFITGPLISTYQPDAFKIDDAPIVKVNTIEEGVALVKKQLPLKPDFIKIWYIARYEETAEQNYSIIQAVIDESHKNNLKVAVHATEINTAKLAIKAGADILVHSIDDPVDDEFIKMMKDRNIIYIPTLVVHKNYINTFIKHPEITDEDLAYANPTTLGSITDLNHLPNTESLIKRKSFTPAGKKAWQGQDKIRKENLRKVLDAGIVVATGTDAGNIGTQHGSSYYDELDAMKDAGMTNKEILLASTLNGAKVFGHEDRFGNTIDGQMADLLVLNSNPLENLNALKDIELVVKGGLVHKPDEIIKPTAEQLAQQQVNAYNARNLDAFLEPYAENVEIYDFSGELIMKGTESMRGRYKQLFEESPELHCEIVKRMELGNKVIDQEKVSGFRNEGTVEAIAIYTINNYKIEKVHFIK